jgi:pimeloyl-ACP methyl ester carboxylesterase
MRFRTEYRHLDESARASAPGDFVDLEMGATHYQFSGASREGCVVLIHGFSIPYPIWDPTFIALTQAGFSTLRYDLYGRGYSDRPKLKYDLDLFVSQLGQLLAALDLQQPVDLIGLSMGGPIALSFAARHPGWVRKIVLIDPAGIPTMSSVMGKVLSAPMMGEVLLGLFGARYLLSQIEKDFYAMEEMPDYVRAVREQLTFRGTMRALLSTLRNDAFSDLSMLFKYMEEQEFPMLLIWGKYDALIPFETNKIVRSLIPGTEFHAIDEAGHIPHYERPEVVNRILIHFLEK